MLKGFKKENLRDNMSNTDFKNKIEKVIGEKSQVVALGLILLD
jgi:hypothetical protein